MRSLGSYTKTIIKLVKESMGGLNIPHRSSTSVSQPAPLFNPTPSPFVTVGDESAIVFTYGTSEYGGEDVVFGELPTRMPKRYYLSLSGE